MGMMTFGHAYGVPYFWNFTYNNKIQVVSVIIVRIITRITVPIVLMVAMCISKLWFHPGAPATGFGVSGFQGFRV